MRKIAPALLSLCLVSGCSSLEFPGVYKIPIEQGNIVTQEMIDQLRPGMTRSQVEFVMGNPLVRDTFNQNRWDYVYRLKLADDEVRKKRLSIFFEGDRLVSFSGDFKPSAAPAGSESAENAPADN